ncbi:acetyltransferase [Vibrio coralliilyticus]|uniref:Acetyltransferase n=1 Tax=Vibrio coralliilyticus TaxID=190893 RepID=A0A2A2MRU0_9VIBR|nr:GNAT family N-acetyltransferase [Vibrio coralliilyticus]KJY73371.1 acetyltransferase [Vibrio coralliilyticus]NOI77438.1 GNAT family N-acetyltransferase [Vibrio coralliilyticus]PAW02945.1 N-acetyltransferase [Vibrio coralliilyticus]QOU33160.1 GNAT family N-acetyltransferase [Vibrio coralliilyticus]
MEILTVSKQDLSPVSALVLATASTHIFPQFSQQGQRKFKEIIVPDLRTVFEKDNFIAVKAISGGQLHGFAALRDGDYLTHLFVANHTQGAGVGRHLLHHLLGSTDASLIRLRASPNAVSFYEQHGFVTIGDEVDAEGIRFVPMALNRIARPCRTG